MKLTSEVHLTPAVSTEAGPDNYCYWNGEDKWKPASNVGRFFRSKAMFAEQVYKDYPDGLPEAKITGWPVETGSYVVIGQDGFGWFHPTIRMHWKRFPHIGGVTFGDEVEVGSHVTIDRGAIGDTYIGTGVKIDNGVHIGHNAIIGANTLITAHAVIGGSAILGQGVYVGLGAVIKNHIYVGPYATIGMGAVVVKDVPYGETWVGNPAAELVR
jgi:UDP-3-O-[3-hydroxymyristoyl] glucosamine N-acyltransferase